jgi:uncharacterized membrane protein
MMISLIVTLVVVGVLLYVVETMIPMDPTMKRIIHIVVILGALVFVLRAFGVV